MYDYKESKVKILEILGSKTDIEKKDSIPLDDSKFTYGNGIMSWTSAIFIDIVKSSDLLNKKDEKLARLMRALTSEIISIFKDSDNYRQIGIRGDCVYAIYSTPKCKDIHEVFSIASKTNTFMKMFNKLLIQNGYNEIKAGIGLGCDETLIIKAGRIGTGINDRIWIGDSVIDASNLSSKANRNGIGSIALSTKFYHNIKDEIGDVDWFTTKKDYFNNVEYYHCNVINIDFNNWINEGMKN